MKVSIITVCFNNAIGLKETIESILSQDHKNFEYIVVDGKSKDNTIDVIREYEKQFENKKIDFIYISEPDKGIYDAMNKGIKLAKGKWVNFMNSGDKFYSEKVLRNVFNCDVSFNKKALVYGYKYQDGKALYPKNIQALRSGLIMANHQSMFFNKSLLKGDLIYKLKYTIYGDYELVNRIYLKYGKEYFEYIDQPIAIYEGGGISELPSFQKRKDKYSILIKHYGVIGVLKGLIGKILKK